MNILGISAFYHDSAACLIRDGAIVAAVHEERFTRKKHDARWPRNAIAYCLREGGIEVSDLDYVAFYDKPLVKFDRLLQTYVACAPRGVRSFLTAIPLWVKEKLWIPDLIRNELPGYEKEILFPEHHESHAASAFFPSPFEEAAILTMDGVGEWTTTSLGVGRGRDISLRKEIHFPHSLGLLYSAFTYYLGFKVNSGEYKVMGLAPYGEPKHVDCVLERLLDLREDGSFRLNMDYFDYCAGLTMTNARFHRLFGGAPRRPEAELTQREMDIAATVQAVCEEVMIRLARHAHEVTRLDDLCLAGGVALNCVGNGRILREGPFKRIWIQPAAGDAGGAIGAALTVWHTVLGRERIPATRGDGMRGALLGPAFSDQEIEAFLVECGASYRTLDPRELPARVAALIDEQNVVGWFQGRMEFGPRALGSRSILGDARSETMQSTMNQKIKFRESFRPFAPSVLRERVSSYFELDCDSPYMLLVAPVREELRFATSQGQQGGSGFERLRGKRSSIPAVTHVDYSARIQTVERDDNPLYYDTIQAFERQTGCGVIINTSFNVRGEPIVCSPEDAYRCFMRTHMDHLVLGRHLLAKNDQAEWREGDDWRREFTLD